MRSGSRRLAILAASAVICLLGLSAVAFASTITTPVGATFSVPGDAAGNPQPFTVVATGFTPTSLVFIEQCDGVDHTTKDWSPTVDCDLGTSPSPIIVDASGKATALATDSNHAFTPFKGESPQSLFNCLSPTQASPVNGLPDFRNCQMRISSNNNAITADQSFVNLVLPDPGGTTTTTASSTTTVPGSSTTTVSSTSTTMPTTTSTASTSTTTVSSTSTTTSTSVPASTSTTSTTADPTGSTTTTIAGSSTSTTVSALGTDDTTPTTFAAVAVDAGTGSSSLPFTGGSSMPIAAGGLVLIVAGIGLAVGGSKRVL